MTHNQAVGHAEQKSLEKLVSFLNRERGRGKEGRESTRCFHSRTRQDQPSFHQSL